MQLEDWLDDLCVRFIINLPPEELASVERICFQVEEAQWFYEDFIRPLDPSLPSLSLKQFSLRIFQHCPLFSQWSAQHHTTAFAEFLAYKQRVPVRGAIMLSESMDEVVLVKGWKKGANWSFPRGKINKDEDDLDCAVREVYEETGFDVKAAGLVRPEKEMKYIEVTMREQHMRLYVFKGVPRDTHFEPRTRKEISKIEWYKLNDLPTLKKRAHHENDDQPAMNANKFYMVAPFLHPLKKWIAQQRKKEGKYLTSNLAVPPVLAEESATENEGYQFDSIPLHNAISPPMVSNLPEVLPMQHSLVNPDPSAHLKELLKIGTTGAHVPTATPQLPSPGLEVAKSNALLALLRNGTPKPSQSHTEPTEEGYQHQEDQTQPVWQHAQDPIQASQTVYPPQSRRELPDPSQQSLLQLFNNASQRSVQQATPSQPAPYQRTGDPEFVRGSPGDAHSSMIPPANALPKLTHHTRALLNAFQSKEPDTTGSPLVQSQPQMPKTKAKQALLDAFKVSEPNRAPVPPSIRTEQNHFPQHVLGSGNQILPASQQRDMTSSTQATSLLDLFKRPTEVNAASSSIKSQFQQNVPAELAAAPVDSPRSNVTSQDDYLAALFRKDKPSEPPRQRSPVAKAGQTGATISGPLNQPNLETIAKPLPNADHELRRSPVPTHRVLYNPKQPAPVKILSRPENKNQQQQQQQQSRSPRVPKSHPATSSPNRHAKSQEKPFQPQILRRPQVPESRQSLTPSPSSLAPANATSTSRRPSNLVSSSPSPRLDQGSAISPAPIASPRRVSEQSDTHKQTLLQLFGGITPTATAPPMPKISSKQIMVSPGAISPVMQSHIVSPVTDEPISTRSRVGSLASIISGGGLPGPAVPSAQDGRPKPEKRQTTAEDKAFLLNYLGKFANQES